jgi:chorismate mutase
MNPQLELSNIRNVLIRQEETIIFALVERAQFSVNEIIYRPGGIPLRGYDCSFVDYLLHGTEKLHATVRRYTSPDEYPFFDDLPEPILPPIDFGHVIQEHDINANRQIKEMYINKIIPAICAAGDDEQYGSSAVCDVACLQALSKRIHYGMFVAESKFLSDTEEYTAAIEAGNNEQIREMVTDTEVEEKLLKRVERKAATYGQEVDSPNPEYKIKPAFVAELYKKWVIPLTKEVEVEYLLGRVE